jgi:hypothetical protein
MYHSLVTIDSLIGEHVAIRGQMELVRGITQEWEELLTSRESLQQSPDRLQTLEEKRSGLKQAMGYLEDGLKNHHAHEDKVMPDLVGNLLMKAIRIEHVEMVKMMNEINSLVVNESLGVFLEKGNYIMQLINNMRNVASSHSTKEDGMLIFLKKLPELK